MKLRAPTKDLRDALARLSSIPGANGASIHSQVVTITADLAGITLMRFSSEAQISIILEDEIEIEDQEGSAHVSHSAFSALVATCGTKIIEIESDEKIMRISSGRSNSKLKVFGEDLLTEPPEPELETESINILLEDLVRYLSFVIPAVGKDSANGPCFCGVCVRMVGGKLYFMATDRKRCHVAMGDYTLPVDCVIPTEGVEAILKAIGTQSGGATLAIGGNTLRVVSATLEVAVTLLVDKYPDGVQKFLDQPASSIQSKIVVNRDEFVEALKTCVAINEDDIRTVTVEIKPKSMVLNGGNHRDSEITVAMDCKATATITIGVPGRQLAQGLEKLKIADDGMVELLQYAGAIFTKTEDQITFFALVQPKA